MRLTLFLREKQIGQNILVDKFWNYVTMVRFRGKCNTRKHAITIEPVRIASEAFMTDSLTGLLPLRTCCPPWSSRGISPVGEHGVRRRLWRMEAKFPHMY